MNEGEPLKQAYKLTHDNVMQLRGVPWSQGSYRIRIFEQSGDVPIVLVADASPNYRIGVAPITQFLAADVILEHFTARLWEWQPMRWIEEVATARKKKGAMVGQPEYWEVRFRSFVPWRRKIFGQGRFQIDEASRRKLKAEELEARLGLRLL